MFNHAAKEELIDRHDVPYFPMAAGVDNIRRTVASKELLENILNEIEKNLKKDANLKKLHPYILFLAGTGKRSGQTAELTWDDVNEERSEEHTSELQSRLHLVCRLLLEKKKHIDHLRSFAAR